MPLTLLACVGVPGPWVWYSSANFSNTQLRQYWQSAVSMRDTYGTPDGVTLPSAAAQRTVTAQTDFSPTTTAGVDPVRDVLHGMQCAKGGKVQLLVALWSKHRADVVRPELNRLAGEGCSVNVILGVRDLHAGSKQVKGVLMAPGQTPDAPEWKGDFAVNYTSRLHIKTLQATGVTFNGKPGRFVYYGGSQNLTDNANEYNNENMVLLTGAATGKDALSQVRGAALAQFDQIWKTQTWYN